MKLLATDLDGTLIQKGAITEANILSLKQFQSEGNLVVVATGRPLVATKHLAQVINYDYAITSCGSMISDSEGNILNRTTINYDLLYKVMELVDDKFEIVMSNGHRLIKMDEFLTQRFDDIIFVSITPKNKRVKVSTDLIAKIEPLCGQDIAISLNKYHIDLGGGMSTKASAIDFLCQKLNIASEDVLVFGDQNNDISMFKTYTNSFYIYGGSKELKKYALNKVRAVSDGITTINPFDVK